jgi:DNA polymerase-3 subunit epsilon
MSQMPIDKVLILDLETTGLNPNLDDVIEIGVILYSLKYGSIITQFSTLLPTQKDINNAYQTNFISIELANLNNVEFVQCAIDYFLILVDQAEFIVAHNAEFDKKWFGLDNKLLPKIDKHWVCTFADFIWDKNQKPTSLINTALNYDIAITNAHRALSDCLLISSLFNRLFERNILLSTFTKALTRSYESSLIIYANVGYDERNLAKEFGFFWDNFSRRWKKSLKSSDFDAEKYSYPFDISFDA